MGRLIEAMWDCTYCKTTGIGGGTRECPHCHAPRDDDVKFYQPTEIEYVSDEEANKINRQPDWLCRYCNCMNSADINICKYCGAERNSENLDYFENQSKKNQEEVEEFDSVRDMSNEEVISEKKNYVSFGKNKWKQLLIIALIISLVCGMIYVFIPKKKEITITNVLWERSMDIEVYKTVEECDWSLPESARLQYSKQEIHSYQNVLDHYEKKSRQVSKQRIVRYESYVAGHRDLGNGYFEEITAQRPVYETYYETEYYDDPVYRQEPVYKTKYYYEIDKWIKDRVLTTSGNDKNPYWRDASNLAENERISNKRQTYYVFGKVKNGKERKISMSYEDWCKVDIGDTVEMKISAFGRGELI